MIKTSLLIFLSIFITGCSQVAYLSQSVSGQIGIWRNQQPIDPLIEQTSGSVKRSNAEPQAGELHLPADEAELHENLRYLRSVRHFAFHQLGLPDNGSYRQYVALDEDYVVYNVVAAHPYSLTPKQWCYPVIGCQSYRGYFSRADAEQYALKLKEDDFDVRVGGVSAYSTLGWFKDPVLSSFFNFDKTELAALIFHELTHQVIYVGGDTMFNESFATAVEIAATRRWIEHWQSVKAKGYQMNADFNETVESYAERLQWNDAVLALIKDYQQQFEMLYAMLEEEKDDAVKAARKTALFENMQQDYQALRKLSYANEDWDKWFGRPLNNADILSVGDYYGMVNEFSHSLTQCNNDFSRFFDFVKVVAKLPEEKRLPALSGRHSCSVS